MSFAMAGLSGRLFDRMRSLLSPVKQASETAHMAKKHSVDKNNIKNLGNGSRPRQVINTQSSLNKPKGHRPPLLPMVIPVKPPEPEVVIFFDIDDDKETAAVRKSGSVCIVQMPTPVERVSFTVQEMLSNPGLYIEKDTKEAKFWVIPQDSGDKFGLYIHDKGHVEPINLATWAHGVFYEANDDLVIIASRPEVK
jgi:hypothetical protein